MDPWIEADARDSAETALQRFVTEVNRAESLDILQEKVTALTEHLNLIWDFDADSPKRLVPGDGQSGAERARGDGEWAWRRRGA